MYFSNTLYNIERTKTTREQREADGRIGQLAAEFARLPHALRQSLRRRTTKRQPDAPLSPAVEPDRARAARRTKITSPAPCEHQATASFPPASSAPELDVAHFP